MSAGLFNMLYSGAMHASAQGKINAQRIRSASANKLAASNASLAQWEQSFQNQQGLKAAGEQMNTVNENLSRSLDAAAVGSFASRLAAAEEVGANLAAAAYVGVGGSSIETATSTLALQQALGEEQQDRAVSVQQYAMGQARGDILAQGIQGQGNQIFQANLDYTEIADHKKMSAGRMLFSTVAAGVAGYFGGPQAAAAVFDLSDSQYRAQNGDFQGGAAMLESSIRGGLTALQGYTQRGNQSFGSQFRRQRAASGANLRIGS